MYSLIFLTSNFLYQVKVRNNWSNCEKNIDFELHRTESSYTLTTIAFKQACEHKTCQILKKIRLLSQAEKIYLKLKLFLDIYISLEKNSTVFKEKILST